MGKKLSEMSLEELWQLFPIFLTGHQACWEDWFREEACVLKEALSETKVKQISHIGSTAIETIWAKPIVDILVEMSEGSDFEEVKEILLKTGYLFMGGEGCRLSFNKGYTEEGFAERVFHLHLRYAGDNDELYFRDYLRNHEETAREYERLKFRLWEKYEYDRDKYTKAKTEFVERCMKRAKIEREKEERTKA